MPHFSQEGHDIVLCQLCARKLNTGVERPQSRPDLTGNESAANVCNTCVEASDHCEASQSFGRD